ncbi:hypothetical protein B8X04_09240 [Brevibacterium casei]|uniref:Uncharacterized protein n=1 Tax=Brevibacterium casei TaxID=33889 RepID=A0A269ZCD8_9MICO|nr:hypothetical protein B8X04_09240 [Brevibacterium casei]
MSISRPFLRTVPMRWSSVLSPPMPWAVRAMGPKAESVISDPEAFSASAPRAGRSVSAGSGSDVGAVAGDACPGSGERSSVVGHRGVRGDADRLGGCGDPLGDIGDVADAFEVER